MDCLSSGVRDQPGQHGETLSLQKLQKVARCGGSGLGSRLRQQQDHLSLGGRGCSEPRSCHCSPAWARERDFVSKYKNKVFCTVRNSEQKDMVVSPHSARILGVSVKFSSSERLSDHAGSLSVLRELWTWVFVLASQVVSESQPLLCE